MFAYQVEQPGMHELMQELRSVMDEYDDRVLVGENDEIVYHGNGQNELHMVFNFPLMKTKQLTPDWIARTSSSAWPSWRRSRPTPGPATRWATTTRHASRAATATARMTTSWRACTWR